MYCPYGPYVPVAGSARVAGILVPQELIHRPIGACLVATRKQGWQSSAASAAGSGTGCAAAACHSLHTPHWPLARPTSCMMYPRYTYGIARSCGSLFTYKSMYDGDACMRAECTMNWPCAHCAHARAVSNSIRGRPIRLAQVCSHGLCHLSMCP